MKIINFLKFHFIYRDDASIEIWSVGNVLRLEKVIVNVPGASIESLVWVKNRLFSAGLAGDITEWDLTRLKSKNTILVTGNSVWCLDTDKTQTQLVAGTEEGFLNLFNVDDNEIVYDKILDKQEGRILCCKFDHSGNIIVTGSIDTIRIWNKTTGHVIHKMSTGRVEKAKETVVWSIYVLKNMTIVSGDSRGRLTFWDGNLGSQIDSYIASKADILCVTANENEDQLFCSGIDPLVKTYTYTNIKRDNEKHGKWVETYKRTYHLNDVKTMACFDSCILTGSADGYLTASMNRSLLPIQKCPPFIQDPVVLCELRRLILFKYTNYIEVWRLGSSKDDDDYKDPDNEEKNIVALKDAPLKVLALKSRKDETIINATISPNGKWILYTTNTCIRIFRFEYKDNETPILTQIKNFPEEFSPSNKIIFSKDSKSLFLYKTNNVIDVFEVLKNDIDYKQKIVLKKCKYLELLFLQKSFNLIILSITVIKDLVHTIVLDDTGKYLVCAGLCHNVGVWTLQENGQWSHYINLPKYKIPITALAIRPNSANVAAAFADNKVTLIFL